MENYKIHYRSIIILLICFILVAYIDTKNLKQYFYNRKIQKEYKNTENLIGLGIKENNGKLKIDDILANTPASKANIKIGDTILYIDGIKFNSAKSIKNYLNYVKKNKKIALTIEKTDNTIIKVELIPIQINNLGQNIH